MDKQSRRERVAQYKQTHPEAGVYRIVNRKTEKSLLGSSPKLASIRNKLAFAQSTNTPSVLDHRLAKDARQFGLDAFSLEILEVLETRPEMTHEQILEDLAVLEALWRERFEPEQLY